jgi:hypothetical protein
MIPEVLIDRDQIGEHPAPQVMLREYIEQRGPGVLLGRRPVRSADIHPAGWPGQIASAMSQR